MEGICTPDGRPRGWTAGGRQEEHGMPKIVVRVLIGMVSLSAAFAIYGHLAQTKASVGQAERSESRQKGSVVGLASPGRVEGSSDKIEVGASTDGVIQEIYVAEGEQVKRDQILAELDCRDLKSALPVTKAEAESLRQTRERLVRGSRQEERAVAAQRTAAAKAQFEQASSQLDRNQKLFDLKLIAQATFEE